MMRGQKKK